jgi:LacI family transcriptional regulator, galactose operon repressor
MKRPTIRDVAALAGVSHQTVSRVLNDQESVIRATRERVLAAIRELGYVPNPSARSLSSNRLHTLGVVTTDISDYFFSQAIAGAEAEARRRGLFLIIGSVEEEAQGDERAYLRLMLERRVEGLIVAGPTHLESDWLLHPLAHRLPIVAIASELGVPEVSVVDVDNQRGGRDATTHLVEHGHRTVATITGPLEWRSARERLDGYREALRATGLAEDPALVEHCSDWSLESGREAARRLLDSGRPFTALFAQSDLYALGAISELRSRGLDVPADVSVVGYDDIPVARYLDPPLTTMSQPMRDVGALAVRLVVEHLAKDGGGPHEEQGRHLLRAPLVARGTVAKAS